jgi:hypothetical protein
LFAKSNLVRYEIRCRSSSATEIGPRSQISQGRQRVLLQMRVLACKL